MIDDCDFVNEILSLISSFLAKHLILDRSEVRKGKEINIEIMKNSDVCMIIECF